MPPEASALQGNALAGIPGMIVLGGRSVQYLKEHFIATSKAAESVLAWFSIASAFAIKSEALA